MVIRNFRSNILSLTSWPWATLIPLEWLFSSCLMKTSTKWTSQFTLLEFQVLFWRGTIC